MLWDWNADVVLTDDVFQPIKACHVAHSWTSKLFLSDGHDLSIVSIIEGSPP